MDERFREEDPFVPGFSSAEKCTQNIWGTGSLGKPGGARKGQGMEGKLLPAQYVKTQMFSSITFLISALDFTPTIC